MFYLERIKDSQEITPSKSVFPSDRVAGLVDINTVYFDFSKAFVGVSQRFPGLPFLMQVFCFTNYISILRAEFLSILSLHHHESLYMKKKVLNIFAIE